VRGQRGSVSLVLAAGMGVALVLTLGVADLGTVLTARARARSAADAAALAAAQESVLPTGVDPAALASDYAARHGAVVVTCACAAGTLETVVEVRVVVDDLSLVPGSHAIDAVARAVVDVAT